MADEAELFAPATQFRARIENPSNFLVTCDGGDPGTPENPSVWLFGLEPGWSLHDSRAQASGYVREGEQYDRYTVELQLSWPFNRNAFRLLAALEGESPKTYADFAHRKRPFEKGAPGYLKSNLFPTACNNLGEWKAEHQTETGFESKEEYQCWMRETRFPILGEWIDRCRPKLIICTGLTHIADFLAIAEAKAVPPAEVISVNGYPKRVHVATDGLAPVAVIPHLSGGTHSLNSYEAITRVAEYIKAKVPLG